MKPSKATHEQLKSHNRQLLLRSVYTGLANSRASLAQATGLAKPTVSDLISELIDEGLLIETGHGESTESGGKRPRLLEFVPEARHVIGVSIDSYRISAVLANLAGHVVAQHYATLDDAQEGDVINELKQVINGLVAQLDAPLLCIGVGVPGVVDAAAGIVRQSSHLGWRNLPLGDLLSRHYDVPVYVANTTELTAVAQFAFNTDTQAHSLATVLINTSVEVGIALDNAAYHQGGDIGGLRVADRSTIVAPLDAEGRLDTFLGWSSVVQRAADLKRQYPDSRLPARDLTYLHIKFAAANGDTAALQLCDELINRLAQVFGWIIGLLRPDHISLAGSIVDLGEGLLSQVIARTEQIVQPELVQMVTFSLTDSHDLAAAGAVAQAVQKELGII